MKEIIKRDERCGKDLYLIFLDIGMAYDTVDRIKLMTLISHRMVDRKARQVIRMR